MLSEGRTSNGRPVWEPPVLDLQDLSDLEKHGKQRKALIKYYKGNPVKVTKFMDIYAEESLGVTYLDWARDEWCAISEQRMELDYFYQLRQEVLFEIRQVDIELEDLEIYLVANKDGTYNVKEWKEPILFQKATKPSTVKSDLSDEGGGDDPSTAPTAELSDHYMRLSL